MSDKDTPQTLESSEAEDAGEKPDLGRERDHLIEALSGTNAGSDTRSGSLRGGSASGSDDDPDQVAIDDALASRGGPPPEPVRADADPIHNTGDDKTAGDDADAAGG